MAKIASQATGSCDGFYVSFYGMGSQVGSANTFPFARGGGGVDTNFFAASATPDTNGGPGGTNFLQPSPRLSAQYDTVRSDVNTFNMAMLAFNTSNITEPPAVATILLGRRQPDGGLFGTDNIASDHKWIIAAVQGSTLPQNEAVSPDEGPRFSPVRRQYDGVSRVSNTDTMKAFYAGGDGGSVQQDYSQAPMFEGFVSGSSFATQGRFYTEPLNVSLLSALSNGASDGMIEIMLNKNALEDMAKADIFVVTLSDYTSYVLNQDMKTNSPSPGSDSFYYFDIQSGIASPTSTPPVLSYVPGRIKDQPPTKERIDKDFTINSFADITEQRVRFTKNTIVADQVPFLLGIKGPLSLRGREFSSTGTPISTTVDPPRTKKDSKD
jgi:hypothetical protein